MFVSPRLTCFGGVGEIGGNKVLLEDNDTKVLLDFGAGFAGAVQVFPRVAAALAG